MCWPRPGAPADRAPIDRRELYSGSPAALRAAPEPAPRPAMPRLEPSLRKSGHRGAAPKGDFAACERRKPRGIERSPRFRRPKIQTDLKEPRYIAINVTPWMLCSGLPPGAFSNSARKSSADVSGESDARMAASCSLFETCVCRILGATIISDTSHSRRVNQDPVRCRSPRHIGLRNSGHDGKLGFT